MTHHGKIAILVVAYNAASTLEEVLDRVPPSMYDQIAEVIVSDDHSQDDTYAIGLEYQQRSKLPITMIRQPHNLGYGGNQKAGYELAIEHGHDYVVLLHGDGQYAPELLPDMVAPLLAGEAEAVFGSRIMIKGAALKGGMPLYKFVGNRILSTFENAMLGTDLTEFHSGYRAYSTQALQRIPFESNTNDFNFDTQIIIQLHEAKQRIKEIPIPTYYGDEICHVNGLSYAANVTKDVLAYRLRSMGLGSKDRSASAAKYEFKDELDSSHGVIIDRLSDRPRGRVLDLGCASGYLAERLGSMGYTVTGVDIETMPGVEDRTTAFYQADLGQGIPEEAGSNFDVVIAGDVLEHLRDPRKLLTEIHGRSTEGGTVLVCVPNIGHWYPRLRTFFGLFDYDQLGILDEGHLRFFTRRSISKLVADTNFEIRSITTIGLPLSKFKLTGIAYKMAHGIDRLLTKVWSRLFGYQFLLELTPEPHGIVDPAPEDDDSSIDEGQ